MTLLQVTQARCNNRLHCYPDIDEMGKNSKVCGYYNEVDNELIRILLEFFV